MSPQPEGRWIPDTEFRKLWRKQRLSLAEIAECNYGLTGWRPSRASVSYHADVLGLPPRRYRNSELLPWVVAPQHHGHWLRLCLQAVALRRRGRTLSPSQRAAARLLDDVLNGPEPKAVAYDSVRGFHLVRRPKDDPDAIIVTDKREPRKREG